VTGPQRVNIGEIDVASLRIIRYPDPRLVQPSVAIPPGDAGLEALVDKMFDLMFEARGVGLAAPQVGLNMRMFVASPTFESSDRRVYLDPQIVSMDGAQEVEEGCLSLPGVAAKIKRPALVTVRAKGIDGEGFEETGEDLLARLFQHEIDHLDGRLITDRMGSLAKLSNRRVIKELEEDFR
jgi:peptide deformylase